MIPKKSPMKIVRLFIFVPITALLFTFVVALSKSDMLVSRICLIINIKIINIRVNYCNVDDLNLYWKFGFDYSKLGGSTVPQTFFRPSGLIYFESSESRMEIWRTLIFHLRYRIFKTTLLSVFIMIKSNRRYFLP